MGEAGWMELQEPSLGATHPTGTIMRKIDNMTMDIRVMTKAIEAS